MPQPFGGEWRRHALALSIVLLIVLDLRTQLFRR